MNKIMVFCDNYGCMFIDEYGFCDCDKLSIVDGICEGSYHSGRTAMIGQAERTCKLKATTAGWSCSACHVVSCLTDTKPNYCPNCGRRVVSE